jgi:hypothetical protein
VKEILKEINMNSSQKRTPNSVPDSAPDSVPDYKEIIRKEWTGAAPLWQKWNHKFVIQTRAATELAVSGAALAAGRHLAIDPDHPTDQGKRVDRRIDDPSSA